MTTHRVRAYPAFWRAAGAALLALSCASLPTILLLVVLATDPPVTPPMLFRLVTTLTLPPAVAAWLIGRAFTAGAGVRDGRLTVERRGLQLEVPISAITGITPWTLPLPEPGFAVRLASGQRLRDGLAAPDPAPLLVALAAAGVDAAGAAVEHPTCIYAGARARRAPRRWYHLLGRFVVFALLPTGVLFNAHQHIAYGALLGEYYLMGLRAWLETLAVYWLTLVVYLVLWASVLRGVAEAACLVAAHVAPARATAVRRVVEATCQVLYYGGVPLLLVMRFLA